MRMEFLQRQIQRNPVMVSMNAHELIRTRKTSPEPTNLKELIDIRSDSIEKTLSPVLALGRIVGFPFSRRFRLLSFRALWLAMFFTFSSSLTLLVAKEQLRNLGVATVGAVFFYFFTNIFILYFLWLSLHWSALRNQWIKLDEMMVGLPNVRVISTISVITTSYIVVGLSEHSLSILDNLRRVNYFCLKNGTVERVVFEMYYRVQYREIFSLINFAMWKGVLTSVMILMLTILWTFSDIFLMCVSLALAARLQQLYLALLETKGKDLSIEHWKKFREIYLDIFFLTRSVDGKISLLLFLSMFQNTYSICIMLLNALSTKTNQDFLQIAYYVVSFTFVFMRLAGTCICAARVNDISKELFPLLCAVPSSSYSIEVHRFIIQLSCEPLTLTAFKFFAVTRNTVLKIAGTILTYEIVLVQCNLLNTDESSRRPVLDCPND